MILTDEEIDYWIESNSTKKALARAVESAVLDNLRQLFGTMKEK